MSTRGHVAIKENGKYKYIYNHHDSYIDGLGITLYKYYKDANKVKELIALSKMDFQEKMQKEDMEFLHLIMEMVQNTLRDLIV